MKTRKVIGTGKVVSKSLLAGKELKFKTHDVIDRLPVDTEVELATYEDAEPSGESEQVFDTISRLTKWANDYGHAKEKQFIADLNVLIEYAKSNLITTQNKTEPERELIVPEDFKWAYSATTNQDTTFFLTGDRWIANIVRRYSIKKYFYVWRIWSENKVDEGSSESIADAQRAVYWKLADLGLYGFEWKVKEKEYTGFIVTESIGMSLESGRFINKQTAIDSFNYCKKHADSVFFYGQLPSGELELIEKFQKESEVK